MKGAGLAAAGLRGHARRLIATTLAISIGVAFFAAVLAVVDGAAAALRHVWSDGTDTHDVVLTEAVDPVTPDVVDEIRALPQVERAVVTGTYFFAGTDGSMVTAAVLPPTAAVELLSGRLPSGPDEVALSTVTAQSTQLEVGDDYPMATSAVFSESAATGEASLATVTGIVDLSQSSMFLGAEAIVVNEAAIRGWPGEAWFTDLRIDLASGADRAAVTAELTDSFPGLVARTGAEEAQVRVDRYTNDVDYLRSIVLGFAAIGMFTTALVIANTFRIVLAQRSRELALLRCIGAGRAQLRRAVLTEAAALGVVAATLGVGLGIGVAWAVSVLLPPMEFFGGEALNFAPSVGSVVAPWVVGVLLAVGAAWWPTRAAVRVAPVAALSAQPDGAEQVRGTRLVRLSLAGLLSAAGIAGLIGAVVLRDPMVGILGGVVSFLGLVTAAVVVIPAAARLLGVVAGRLGVPGDLAVRSISGQPGRAAATGAALLIGVTLITMTSVGAASAERTVEAEIDARLAVDVLVATGTWHTEPGSADADGLSEAAQARLAGVSGVDAVVPLAGARVTISAASGTLQPGATDDGMAEIFTGPVLAYTPESMGPVARSMEQISGLTAGTVGGSPGLLESYGLSVGDIVEVRGSAGTVRADVVQVGGIDVWQTYVAADVLAAVEPSAPVAAMALRVEDGADLARVIPALREVAEANGGWLSGGAVERLELNQAVEAMVMIVTGLLAVAVIIAVVGIANTLSLSVVERSRENALLRALGLTRGQVRASLAVEGVVLALAGTLIGVLAGGVYAWFGVQSILPAGMETRLEIPWLTVLVIAAVAVAAGLLASALPARRAVRVQPAEGLAMW